MKSTGRVTIPTDESFVEGTKEIMQKWGADAVRDCDGTRLPTNAKELGKVYNTYFLYQFTLIFNEQGKEKNVEWFGYAQTANPVLIDAFAKESGIQLTAEDFIDNGYCNNAFRSPTDKFRKWQDFIARFVSKTVRELVDICHEYGKAQ